MYLTHIHTQTYTQTDARTHTSRWTDTHLPSSKHLIWVIAISGKNTALGHISPPALPPSYSPPASSAPSFPMAFFVTTPLSFLRQHCTSHWLYLVFNLDNFLNLLTLFHPLCVFFPPRTLGCVTPESCIPDKVTVS